MKLSPHVTIYKFPLVAISSITNRLSGLALSGLYVSTGMICLTDNIDNVNKFYNTYKDYINYSIVFPSMYHTLGSIRHFIWDKYPKLLTNTSVRNSSIGLLSGSLLGTWLILKK
tara:strand:+ start:1097 stop:1438 length:342 start_codon:yes stop_codon:yes gene_type:complete